MLLRFPSCFSFIFGRRLNFTLIGFFILTFFTSLIIRLIIAIFCYMFIAKILIHVFFYRWIMFFFGFNRSCFLLFFFINLRRLHATKVFWVHVTYWRDVLVALIIVLSFFQNLKVLFKLIELIFSCVFYWNSCSTHLNIFFFFFLLLLFFFFIFLLLFFNTLL